MDALRPRKALDQGGDLGVVGLLQVFAEEIAHRGLVLDEDEAVLIQREPALATVAHFHRMPFLRAAGLAVDIVRTEGLVDQLLAGGGGIRDAGLHPLKFNAMLSSAMPA